MWIDWLKLPYGKHHFEFIEDAGEIIKAGEVLKSYADTNFLLEPIDNPEILRK